MNLLALSCLSSEREVEMLLVRGSRSYLGRASCASSFTNVAACAIRDIVHSLAHEVALFGILGSSSSGGPTESPALCQGVRAQLREAEGSAVIGGLLGELMTGLLLGRIAVAHF